MKWLSIFSEDNQNGTSGVEAALLIGVLVTVSSVFAYVVMSVGLVSSQKAKDAVYSGLEGASTTLELKGNVSASMDSGVITRIYLVLGCLPGGKPVDFTDTAEGQNKCLIAFTDANNDYVPLNWKKEMIGTNNGDNFLDPGEICRISIDMSPINDAADTESKKMVPFHQFTLAVVPQSGATLTIERTIPSTRSQFVNLN